METTRLKKAIVILFAVLFLVTVTISAVSAAASSNSKALNNHKITQEKTTESKDNHNYMKATSLVINNGLLKIIPGYPGCDICNYANKR